MYVRCILPKFDQYHIAITKEEIQRHLLFATQTFL